MPVSAVTWLWIDNRTAIAATPTRNVTQDQLNAAGIIGHLAIDPRPVVVSGVTQSDARPVFSAPFNPIDGHASDFSFDSPTANGVAGGQQIAAAFRADITLTLSDGATSAQVATVLQMSNGDIFVQPNANILAVWDGIAGLRSIAIDGATPLDANAVFDARVSFAAQGIDANIPCFTQGTMILTPKGERPVETLRAGDVVMTLDHGPQVIRWIASRRLSAAALAQNPALLPIRISAGALGNCCPEADLIVSPQHRVLGRSHIAERMFEAGEVLIAAADLVGLPGIAVDTGGSAVTYFHFLCDAHEVVFANGAPTESFYPGPTALRALGDAASDQILTLFPALRDLASFDLMPVRMLATGRESRLLVERHQKAAVQILAA